MSAYVKVEYDLVRERVLTSMSSAGPVPIEGGAVVAGLAFREMVRVQPVFHGDVLTGWVRVDGASPPRNGMAQLEVEGHLEKMHGKTVTLRLDGYVNTARASGHRWSSLQRSGSGGSTCGQAAGDDHG